MYRRVKDVLHAVEHEGQLQAFHMQDPLDPQDIRPLYRDQGVEPEIKDAGRDWVFDFNRR